MEVIRLEKNITSKDIEEINSLKPVIIELRNTSGQKADIIRQLNKEVKIRISGEFNSEINTKDVLEEDLYTPEELAKIIEAFEKIESGIDSKWTDLEKATYIYIQLILAMQFEEDGKKIKDASERKLSAILKGRAVSRQFASTYKEFMSRLGIPCKCIQGQEHTWNEVQIDGKFYPLDVSLDSIYYHSKESAGNIGICNFLTDRNFYKKPIHHTKDLSEEELKTVRIITPELVNKAFETVMSRENLSNVGKVKAEERPTITLESKELNNLYKDNTITTESLSEKKSLKISVTDQKFNELKKDLKQIARFYPELLRNIEFENTSSSHVNIQEALDEIYSIRTSFKNSDENQQNFSVTISSSNAEDFNLDFSKAPKTVSNSINVSNDHVPQNSLVLKNTGERSIKLPKLASKFSSNISELTICDFDLSDMDVVADTLIITGQNTSQISNIPNVRENLVLNNIPDNEFDNFMRNVYSRSPNIVDLSIIHQNLNDRKILQELYTNSNLTWLNIDRCHLNDLDGLEQYVGARRLGQLYLNNNDLTISDLERLNNYIKINPKLIYQFQNNTGIETAIRNVVNSISQETYDILEKNFITSGMLGSTNKAALISMLLRKYYNMPYCIKDASVMRDQLKLIHNPMTLENDSDIDIIDFNANHISDGTLLLTIPQIERLIQANKKIPQNIRIKIESVADLSCEKLRELNTRLKNIGNNLTEVQIFDKSNGNTQDNIYPYPIAEYDHIRYTLDTLVDGILPTDADIDKFATIYTRICDTITYDTRAMYNNNGQYRDRATALYTSDRCFTARNLSKGLEMGKYTCVCAGYADILRNALSLVGIDSRYVRGPGHAWNQVLLDDGSGNKKWYFTDSTWDAGHHQNPNDGRYDIFMLRGDDYFRRNQHPTVYTKNLEPVEKNDYDRTAVQQALARAQQKSFRLQDKERTIDIPQDPKLQIQLDDQRIKDEFERRKNDMYAKFYGNKDYEREYKTRIARLKEHIVDITDNNGITYQSIANYAEKNEDETFLFLDKYQECLERVSRFQAGDTLVYSGTQEQIQEKFRIDQEYINTNNHAFNQNRDTQRDLATLGKYGEKVPYIPKQQGALKNIGRIFLNFGILGRNIVAPVYRVIGRYVAQPIHRLITRGRDASPYKNNSYHRMVARRDYFFEEAQRTEGNHPLVNGIKSRVRAFTRAREGNEAVLRAGAADIAENIKMQERQRATINTLQHHINQFDSQIRNLEIELQNNPHARNADDVRNEIARKGTALNKFRNDLAIISQHGIDGDIQTDAISDSQHAIASKEVNTLKVTIIKGVAKVVAAKFVGPKIDTWLAQRGKVFSNGKVIPTNEITETKKWVPTTYKTENQDIFKDVIDTSKSMQDIMSANKGKSITGFYSVYGGESRPSVYQLTGNEKITGIFQSIGKGGTGLSDKVGLTAPTLTDRVFSNSLLDSTGLLNQNTTLQQLVDAVSSGSIDPTALDGIYVSVGDNYWAKLFDLVGSMTKKIKVDTITKKVVDVAGHYETVKEVTDVANAASKVVANTAAKTSSKIATNIAKGVAGVDGIYDIAENLRKTSTDVQSNKQKPRQYTFDEDLDDIPTSKRDYREQNEDRN